MAKNWPQCALNRSAPATSLTNSAFLAMPVDRTYLLDHVLFAHAQNCSCMTGNGHQQALYCIVSILPLCALLLYSLRYYISADAVCRGMCSVEL